MEEGIKIAIEEVQDRTGFKVNEYLIRINQFFISDYPKIRDWYKGVTNNSSPSSFKNLFRLLADSGRLLMLFHDSRNTFTKYYHWEFLDKIENINSKLLTTLNLSKFLRSTRTRNSYKSSLEVDYVMKKYDTLEKVQRKEISPVNFDNDWWEIAMRNDLSEVDYDINGGKAIKLPTEYDPGTFLASIVDNPVGDKLYGRDIKRKLTFKDDDLETLSYKDTVYQSLDIMLETRMGTVPENPNIGYNENLVVGGTKGTIGLPILQKQLISIFNTDDSFSSFKITRIEFENDALFIDFEVNTVRGEMLSKTAKIG